MRLKDVDKKRIVDIFSVGVISVILICIQMRIWHLDFNVTLPTGGDDYLGLSTIKSIKEFGFSGLWFNPRIGAPEISSLIDVPFMDYAMVIIVWVACRVASSASAALYIVYILSFPLAAICMNFLLNVLTSNRLLNNTLSLIFALTPYHFLRNTGHISLTLFYILPIGIYLAIMVYKEEFSGGVPNSIKKNWLRRSLFYFMIFWCGISNIYYSFFIMLVILIAMIFKMIEKNSFKPMLNEARVFYGMAVVFLMGIAPKIVYGIMRGGNELAGKRGPSETEIYSLKLIQMLVPPSYSKVGFLKNIFNSYSNNGFNINENACASLGAVGSIGFLVLCGWFILRYVRKTKADSRILSLLAMFAVSLVLYCSAGGFGTIFSYLITPELRGLNRVSIMILCISLAALAIIVADLVEKRSKLLSWIICLFAISLTLVYDVPAMNAVNIQDGVKIQHSNDQEFFGKIENELQSDEMVYQIPMVEFPEMPPVNNMADYALLKAYVYTDKIRWSYGGVKGRETVATDLFIDNGIGNQFLDGIIQNGYSGIYIDTSGYEDGGIAVNNYYHETLGLDPIVSKDSRLYFYDLRSIKD